VAGPVIITRAEPGNSQTAARLAEAGLPYICAPMLAIEPTGERLPSLGDVQGLLFTSANGVRAFCAASQARSQTAWCVGPATLAAARDAGFMRLEHADGNADDLARLVIDKAAPHEGALVHVANAAAVGKLAARLSGAGFEVEFAPIYAARPLKTTPVGLSDALESVEPCVLLVHSAKGAAAFAGVIGEVDLSGHCLVVVSEAAAGPLAAHKFGKTYLAKRPNEAALMQALFRAYSTL